MTKIARIVQVTCLSMVISASMTVQHNTYIWERQWQRLPALYRWHVCPWLSLHLWLYNIIRMRATMTKIARIVQVTCLSMVISASMTVQHNTYIWERQWQRLPALYRWHVCPWLSLHLWLYNIIRMRATMTKIARIVQVTCLSMVISASMTVQHNTYIWERQWQRLPALYRWHVCPWLSLHLWLYNIIRMRATMTKIARIVQVTCLSMVISASMTVQHNTYIWERQWQRLPALYRWHVCPWLSLHLWLYNIIRMRATMTKIARIVQMTCLSMVISASMTVQHNTYIWERQWQRLPALYRWHVCPWLSLHLWLYNIIRMRATMTKIARIVQVTCLSMVISASMTVQHNTYESDNDKDCPHCTDDMFVHGYLCIYDCTT